MQSSLALGYECLARNRFGAILSHLTAFGRSGLVRKSLYIIVLLFVCAAAIWATLFALVRTSDRCLIGYGDERLIDTAIRHEISSGMRDIDLHPDDLIDYRSLDEFKQKNKRCYMISRAHFEETNALERAFGATEVSVDFWYQAKREGSEPFYRSYVVMNACRKVLASHGLSLATGANTN
jgi:hypothetical protein